MIALEMKNDCKPINKKIPLLKKKEKYQKKKEGYCLTKDNILILYIQKNEIYILTDINLFFFIYKIISSLYTKEKIYKREKLTENEKKNQLFA